MPENVAEQPQNEATTPPSPASAADSASTASPGGAGLGARTWFVACVVMLSVLTVGFEVYFRKTVFTKEALPLKKPLELLAQKELQPYALATAPIILQPDMVDALGTQDYIQWLLLDESRVSRPTAEDLLYLFVTYYTGKPDQVPHVPEQCMYGNGYTETRNREITIRVPGLPAKDQEIPIQVLHFEKQALSRRSSRLVMYTFRTNDTWCSGRDCVRSVVGNPFVRHAYFSKLELGFDLPEGGSEAAIEAKIAEGERFLKVVVPVLMRDHWPAWPGQQQADTASR